MLGPLFLYSTSPAPHERTILELAGRSRRLRSRPRSARWRSDSGRPISAVVMQTALPEPNDAELDGLRNHFCTQGFEVALCDSGLANREDARRESVAARLREADLVLITGGSPALLYERTVDTPALAALRAASENGAVVAGCSAGAAVFGAGMVDRNPLALWGWLPRILVAPHYGKFDIGPWLDAFPNCEVLGIPDNAMALVADGTELRTVSDTALVLRTADGRQKLQRRLS